MSFVIPATTCSGGTPAPITDVELRAFITISWVGDLKMNIHKGASNAVLFGRLGATCMDICGEGYGDDNLGLSQANPFVLKESSSSPVQTTYQPTSAGTDKIYKPY